MSRKLFIAGALLLAAYAFIFSLLTFDTIVRIFSKASTMETPNLLLLIFLEMSRLIASVVAVIIALVLIARRSDRSDGRALSIFLLFTVILYEKAVGANGFPGPVQENVAGALLQAGISPRVLSWFFGPSAWPAWPAIAALLRFSAVFPKPLEAEMLEASGRSDRQGFLRAARPAGADVGAYFRRVSLSLLNARAFTTPYLAAGAVVLAIIQTLTQGVLFDVVLGSLAFLALCVAFTNLRAAYVAAEGEERVRMTWLVEGFVVAVVIFVISSSLLMLVPGRAGMMAAFLLFTLAPLAVMVCLALSVLDKGELDSRQAIDETVRGGTIALFATFFFGVLYQLFGAAVERLGMSHALAPIAAAVIVAMLYRPMSKQADRLRLRVLEQSTTQTHTGGTG